MFWRFGRPLAARSFMRHVHAGDMAWWQTHALSTCRMLVDMGALSQLGSRRLQALMARNPETYPYLTPDRRPLIHLQLDDAHGEVTLEAWHNWCLIAERAPHGMQNLISVSVSIADTPRHEWN